MNCELNQACRKHGEAKGSSLPIILETIDVTITSFDHVLLSIVLRTIAPASAAASYGPELNSNCHYLL